MGKRAFDIHLALDRIEDAVQSYPKAALFELAESGFKSTFEQLVACIVSIRTRDEVTLSTARQLFDQARTPIEMVRMGLREIDTLIQACSFHERKSHQIHAIATRALNEYAGDLPCDRSLLLSFDGIGPKCAHLTMGIACGEAYIPVDVHVHRICNRWGYVRTGAPEQTMLALEAKLPRQFWLDINRLLVPFGKHVCTGQRPRCSACSLLDMCQQVDVEAPR